jgi:glycopeptide antibiotics resistance protein
MLYFILYLICVIAICYFFVGVGKSEAEYEALEKNLEEYLKKLEGEE